MKRNLTILLAGLLPGLLACGPSNRPSAVKRGLDDYVQMARSMEVEKGTANGSVWSEHAGYADSFRDVKARRLGDTVTVEVLESTSATSEASTAATKASTLEKKYASLFGLEKKIAELPNLVGAESTSDFSGDASTSRKNDLTTTLTARVLEVFPNRNLLIEGNREILVNGERQIVTLRGVIRPADISPSNTVLSARIAEMELEVSGHGLVSDAQKPGTLFRILSGILPF